MKKLFFFSLLVLGILFLPWIIISVSTTDLIYTDINKIPTKKYGIVLGTSPGSRGSNPFFITRIEAAKELYERGKIEYILVSGDNSTDNYNEPLYMKNALLRAGVPESAIKMDFAGFRTLDSVLRAKEVFSLTDDITIISQPFHLERALFLAKLHHINAIGYGAANVNLSYGLTTYIREIGARWLALYDIITNKDATVLGEKINLDNEKDIENSKSQNKENNNMNENKSEDTTKK